MATKKMQDDIELPLPLEPVETWEDAAELARSALVFTISDPRESGSVRVKAAELILEFSRPKPRGSLATDEDAEDFESWLSKQSSESRL